MKKSPALYLKLFLSTLQLSAFTFGGGYVIVSLLQKKFVEQFGWITKEEMLDIIAIAQSSPGAIAVNSSILIGYKMAGVKGALCTLLGTILPPLVIISIISFFYAIFRENEIFSAILRGMQAGIAAVIVDVVYRMGKSYFKCKDYLSLAIISVTFALAFILKINVIFIILGGILFGIILYFINKRIDKNKRSDTDLGEKNSLDMKEKIESQALENGNILDNDTLFDSCLLNELEIKQPPHRKESLKENEKVNGGADDDLS